MLLQFQRTVISFFVDRLQSMTIVAMQLCLKVYFTSVFLLLWELSSDVQKIKFCMQYSIPKLLKNMSNQKDFLGAQKQPKQQCS